MYQTHVYTYIFLLIYISRIQQITHYAPEHGSQISSYRATGLTEQDVFVDSEKTLTLM